jgi:hypothetical protein
MSAENKVVKHQRTGQDLRVLSRGSHLFFEMEMTFPLTKLLSKYR